MDKREVYIEWDGEETYLSRVDELCGEMSIGAFLLGPTLQAVFGDIVSSLAFATNEEFSDTIKIIIR